MEGLLVGVIWHLHKQLEHAQIDCSYDPRSFPRLCQSWEIIMKPHQEHQIFPYFINLKVLYPVWNDIHLSDLKHVL